MSADTTSRVLGLTDGLSHDLNAHVARCGTCDGTSLCPTGQKLEEFVNESFAAAERLTDDPSERVWVIEVSEDGLGPLAGTYRFSLSPRFGASLTYTAPDQSVQGLAFDAQETTA